MRLAALPVRRAACTCALSATPTSLLCTRLLAQRVCKFATQSAPPPLLSRVQASLASVRVDVASAVLAQLPGLGLLATALNELEVCRRGWGADKLFSVGLAAGVRALLSRARAAAVVARVDAASSWGSLERSDLAALAANETLLHPAVLSRLQSLVRLDVSAAASLHRDLALAHAIYAATTFEFLHMLRRDAPDVSADDLIASNWRSGGPPVTGGGSGGQQRAGGAQHAPVGPTGAQTGGRAADVQQRVGQLLRAPDAEHEAVPLAVV
jgi:hypothetical protein